MRPKPAQNTSKETEKPDKLAQKFPGLAIPNDGPFQDEPDVVSSTGGKKKKKKDKGADEAAVDDAMAALEALAPSHAQ